MLLVHAGAIIGEQFEDDGTNWRVLEVGWDANVSEVVVWYYSLDGEKDEEYLRDHLDDDDVEHSRVSEVIAWIKASNSD